MNLARCQSPGFRKPLQFARSSESSATPQRRAEPTLDAPSGGPGTPFTKLTDHEATARPQDASDLGERLFHFNHKTENKRGRTAINRSVENSVQLYFSRGTDYFSRSRRSGKRCRPLTSGFSILQIVRLLLRHEQTFLRDDFTVRELLLTAAISTGRRNTLFGSHYVEKTFLNQRNSQRFQGTPNAY